VRARSCKQLDRVERAGSQLDLLDRVMHQQFLGVDARCEVRLKAQNADDLQDMWHQVVDERGQAVQIAKRSDTGGGEVGARQLGPLEERNPS
jgi:hypothetical protein